MGMKPTNRKSRWPVFGHFEQSAAVVVSWTEAWVYYVYSHPVRWLPFDAVEVYWNAGVMTEAEFHSTFGPLPPPPVR